MKVHYESIVDGLRRAIETAERLGRRIDHIELSPSEWYDFYSMCVPAEYHGQIVSPPLGVSSHFYGGVMVTKGASI